MVEAWLSGSVEGIPAALMPHAHAWLHARHDIEHDIEGLTTEQLWTSPGGAASIGWHIVHLFGSTGRLLSYARGEPLSQEQWDWLEREKKRPDPLLDHGQLQRILHDTFDAAMAAYANADVSKMLEPRTVGRAKLPTTYGGLLFHAAEHAARHTGQIVTTAKIIKQPFRDPVDRT